MSSFVLESEVFHFGGREERNDGIDAVSSPTSHLIFKPIAASRAR